MNMSDEDRGRLIEAEWLLPEDEKNATLYAAEVVIYAQNRTGLLVDISRALTERKIDIGQMSVRTNKQGVATLEMSFSVHSKDELSAVIRELRKIQNVVDVTRKTG
jgi:GTP pyrophosphokinase